MMNHTGIQLPTTLRFVESDELWSLYRDRDGDDWYIQHNTGRVLTAFDELDFAALWAEFRPGHRRFTNIGNLQGRFLQFVADRTSDPERIDEIGFCSDCNQPEHEDDLVDTNEGHGSVCETCSDRYSTCADCDERYQYLCWTVHDENVCEYCRDNNYGYCDDCDGYYHHDTSDEHDHDNCEEGDGCCESPAMQFTVRNDGEAPLANDVRTTVTLPAGVISAEGLGAIARHIRVFGFNLDDPDEARQLNQLSYDLHELGDQWQARQGNYTKRLSRHAYKNFDLKIRPEMISQVGNIARDHSQAVDFAIEVTRNLNLSAGQFAHEDSCWWQSYYASRCALKSNGGFGLRTFSKGYGGYEHVSGRAWVIPVRKDANGKLVPTFETLKPDAFVVFNGYGDLSGYTAARVMSHMAGMTYRKVSLDCDPMYINSDAGYLVAPEEIAEPYTDGHLSLPTEQHSDLFVTETESGLFTTTTTTIEELTHA